MAKKSSWNPLAFVPAQVSFLASAVYIALFAVILWIHHDVPNAPSNPTPFGNNGINLTTAWLDLSYISDGYHPIDSKRNEIVREYLLQRIEAILDNNNAEYKIVKSSTDSKALATKSGSKAVTVFDDRLSNVTIIDSFHKQPWTCYSESTNIIVYIRGKDDPEGDFWDGSESYDGPGGVLVNAHYDSVSSGYGATDDGVGVVTVLQLISYFSQRKHQPKRGLVALLNNGEENSLYGAHEFLRHPISQFPHIFLNLEGAGAGGRATLFRSTDAQVTKFYSQSPYPFGSVVSADGFKRGFVRSGTDYSVFNSDNRMRGVDVAFFEPRARYHTNQDDARDTSPDSVWHMLTAALATAKAMTSYSGHAFDGSTRRTGVLDIKSGSDAVYFDLLGRAMAVLQLPTLFALSVTLLVAGPVLLIVFEAILRKLDKWYPLAKKQYLHSEDDDEAVHFSGVRGLFRFPLAFVVATAVVLTLAYLLTKINPYILYSSEYAVWAMMLSAWFAISWFFLAGADRVRPTALQRMYCLVWVYAFTWLLLVAGTVGENNFSIGGGYMLLIYNAAAFLALLISYFELLALPTKTSYVEHVFNAEQDIHGRSRPVSQSSRSVLSASRTRRLDEDEDANERTSLLGGGDRRSGKTFSKIGKRNQLDDEIEESDDKVLNKAYGEEQPWSSSLPQWTWVIQLILLAPITVIVIGQVALLLTSALHQTPADGNPVLPIYLFIAVLALLLLIPLTPFLHRFTYSIATLLFLVFVATLIYNLVAFPFSAESRLKVYFVQQVDLDSGVNNVTLVGLNGYLQDIIGELPSAAGQKLRCGDQSSDALRNGLQRCSWHGVAPNVLDNDALKEAKKSKKGKKGDEADDHYAGWIDYNVTAGNGTAHFSIQGRNTKQCRLIFDEPVTEIKIKDAASDPRYQPVAENGSKQIRLLSRDWDKKFEVDVAWPDHKTKGKTGKVLCIWADANQRGVIPAFDEMLRFQPIWSAVTKGSDGLVEGFREFGIK